MDLSNTPPFSLQLGPASITGLFIPLSFQHIKLKLSSDGRLNCSYLWTLISEWFPSAGELRTPPAKEQINAEGNRFQSCLTWTHLKLHTTVSSISLFTRRQPRAKASSIFHFPVCPCGHRTVSLQLGADSRSAAGWLANQRHCSGHCSVLWAEQVRQQHQFNTHNTHDKTQGVND